MELTNEIEIKAHLIQHDDLFRTLSQQHHDWDEKLILLEAKCHLTEEEQVEEIRLKKLKLHAKDQMREMIGRYQAHQNG